MEKSDGNSKSRPARLFVVADELDSVYLFARHLDSRLNAGNSRALALLIDGSVGVDGTIDGSADACQSLSRVEVRIRTS
jgi:23S rRNA pseudoU1915 N3-methylase RlmH